MVFLPSYAALKRLSKAWMEEGIWAQFQSVKTVVQEPSGGGVNSFNEAKQSYRAAVQSGRGALLFAVFRGKMSEGISFNDQYARGVVLVGIPYPNVKDAKVACKKDYDTAESNPT